MKALKFVKVVAAAVLLLVIISLPTLTATQLVQVLGVTSSNPTLSDLKTTPLGDSSTFIYKNANSWTVSYLTSGSHSIFSLNNPTTMPKAVSIEVSSREKSLLSQTVYLVAGLKKYTLFDQSSSPSEPSYHLTVPPYKTLVVGLQITSHALLNYGTISLIVRGN